MSNHQTEDMGTLQDIFQRAYQEQIISVTTTEKGGYDAALQTIYGVPLPHSEDNHEAINDLHIIVQGM